MIRQFALGFLALGLCSQARAETWHRADTHHFVIYSDGSSRTLEDFAERAEMFDALFRQYFGLQPKADPLRVTIYLLEDSEDVSRLAGDEDGSLAGFYRVSRDGSFAVANRARSRRETGLSGQTVLFHEYVHHLMASEFTYAYPAWYREGFAEYFATATFEDDGDWTLGEPANHRAYSLRQVRLQLENVVFGTPSGQSTAVTSAYYGMSWAMVHMFANDPERTRQMNAYLSQLGSGVPAREAFAATIGDVAEVESELDDYIDGRLNRLNSVEPIGIVGSVRVTTLDTVASQLAELEMRRRVGCELEDVRAALSELAARNPDNADAWVQLALTEQELAEDADEADLAATEAAVDRALAIAPENAVANTLKAELLLDAKSPDLDVIRGHLTRAIASDPLDPRAPIVLYETYNRRGERPPVEIVNGLLAAFLRVPEAHEIRVMAAYALVNEGLVGRAINLVEFLAADPHAGEYGRRVLADLRAIQNQR